ncbi:MAG: hypothetical protein P4L82_07845 [Ancalomicrobiaceae bacterium]|nr:hypothetical protein [Ancalomicrobiaceae bacterium]
MQTSSHPKPQTTRRRRWLVSALAATAVGGLVAVGFGALAQQPASAGPAIPAAANFTSWADNGKDGERVLQLVRGDVPVVGAFVSGVVKTDTNCDPDAEGISHCHNVIGLDNGGEIEVIDNHAMMSYACLAPDQKVSLAKVDANWITAKDAE